MKALSCILASTLALSSLCAGQPTNCNIEPNWLMLVGDYPQPGTPGAPEELAIMVWLQRTRTAEDIARAKGEVHSVLASFQGVLPATLSADGYPMTMALLERAAGDLMPIVHALKNRYGRPRPYATYPVLNPALPRENSCSFPSGEAALGLVFAQIIAQFQPSSREALMEKGALVGDDRVMAGLHYPSDVQGGQKLGRAFSTYWINQPENRQAIIEACKAEWHPKG